MLTINSPAFAADQKMPQQFSRDGGNMSPPIEWRGAPAGTRSYALIVEDPDAPTGTFLHWGAYDIPANMQRLSEGAGSSDDGVSLQMAVNDFGNARYDGPQPPPGHGTHHYHFRLFALDVPTLEMPLDCAVEELLEAAEDHVLAEAEYIGTFEKH